MGINISSRLRRPTKLNLGQVRPKSKKAKFTLLVTVLLFAALVFFFTQNSQDTTQNPEKTGALNFYILREDRKGSFKRLLVYTTENSDARLIQLNDQLIATHKEGVARMYIEYHSNMEAAVKSYDLQIDPSARDREKDPFFDHFVASAVYSTTGNKRLMLEGRQPKLLKEY